MSWISKVFKFLSRWLNIPSKQWMTERTLKRTIINKKVFSHQFTRNPKELGNTKILIRSAASAKETRWIFKVVAGTDQGREFIAVSKKIRVGRHPENLILLRDPKVSRFHAIFYSKGSRLFLEDLGSTNGTRINGEVVLKKKAVFSGDQIKIGETLIRVIMKKD